MSALVGTVLAASLVGSPHCAGMCGGIAWMAAPGPAPSRRALAAYHLSRLAGYAVLGALAGALGGGVDRLGAFAGIGRTAALVAGAVMLAWGAATVLTALGVRLPRPVRVPTGKAMVALAPRVAGWPPAGRGTALGLLTVLLPCGWLWVFVAMAGATSAPLAGAGVMAVFWIGTVPALTAVAFAARKASGPLRRYLPLVTGGALMVVGAITMVRRGAVMGPMSHGHAPAVSTDAGAGR